MMELAENHWRGRIGNAIGNIKPDLLDPRLQRGYFTTNTKDFENRIIFYIEYT